MSLPQYKGEINRYFFIHFFSTIQIGESHARFPGGKYNVLDFLAGVQESMNDDTEELVAVMQYN